MMPRLSCWSINLALIYFAAGITLGTVMLINKAMPFWDGLWAYTSLHVQWVLFGWTFQLIMGVAYWVLPTFGGRDNRGNSTLAYISIACLNIGVLVSSISVMVGDIAVLTLLGTCLSAISAATFAGHAWPRIKAFGK